MSPTAPSTRTLGRLGGWCRGPTRRRLSLPARVRSSVEEEVEVGVVIHPRGTDDTPTNYAESRRRDGIFFGTD